MQRRHKNPKERKNKTLQIDINKSSSSKILFSSNILLVENNNVCYYVKKELDL